MSMPKAIRQRRTSAPAKTTTKAALKTRPAIQTKPAIQDWARDILLQSHAIAPCTDHGFMRLRFNHASIDYAHALATHTPYPGLSKVKCIAAVDDVLDGLSDQCPACG